MLILEKPVPTAISSCTSHPLIIDINVNNRKVSLYWHFSLGQTNLSCPQSLIPAFTFLRLHVLYWMNTYLYVIEYVRRTKSAISEFTIALKTDFHGEAIMMEKENQ